MLGIPDKCIVVCSHSGHEFPVAGSLRLPDCIVVLEMTDCLSNFSPSQLEVGAPYWVAIGSQPLGGWCYKTIVFQTGCDHFDNATAIAMNGAKEIYMKWLPRLSPTLTYVVKPHLQPAVDSAQLKP